MRELAGWRVSTYSAGEGNCVEVGTASAVILVRDTKNRAAAPLRISPAAWHQLTETVTRFSG